MKPSYSTALVIGAITGVVVALSLLVFFAASGAVPSLTAVPDGSDVVPTLTAPASATWIIVILAGAGGGLVVSIATFAVGRVLDPEASSAPLAVVAPLGAIVGAVIGMVVFPLGITVAGSISEGNANIGVADLTVLTAITGLVGGGAIAWLSYILVRPSSPADDPELLAA
jgi:hypothetical protein